MNYSGVKRKAWQRPRRAPSKETVGWDDPLSEPQRTWIVPAESVGLEAWV
jgi:hypothetical protein